MSILNNFVRFTGKFNVSDNEYEAIIEPAAILVRVDTITHIVEGDQEDETYIKFDGGDTSILVNHSFAEVLDILSKYE